MKDMHLSYYGIFKKLIVLTKIMQIEPSGNILFIKLNVLVKEGDNGHIKFISRFYLRLTNGTMTMAFHAIDFRVVL